MKKKLPSLARTPSGLKKPVIEAVRKKATGVTSEAVERVLAVGDDDADEDAEEDADYTAAREFLASVSSVEPTHVWWILANRDLEAAQAAELGLADDTEQEDGDLIKALKYLRSRYVYASFRNELWDRRAKDWISTQSLTNAEAHRMPFDDFGERRDAFKLLRGDEYAARVHNEQFVPGDEREIVEVADKPGVEWLNTWVPPKVKPVKGSAKIMLDHILYLCNGNKEHAGMIVDWLAYAYQNPGKKINYALLIISGYQGVGKDTLALAMARLLGEENVPFIDDDAIAEGRNEYMKRAQLVVVPEVMCGDRRDVSNKMKPIITQPVVRINEKNQKPYFTPNRANVAMFSNHENAAYIEDGDRRHLVIICKSKPHVPEYYDALYEYIEGDGIAGFAWFLKHRDLSNFNPKANAPHTEYKDTVRAATKAGWEAFLQDAWDSNASPFDRDVVSLREALAAFGEMKGSPRLTVQQIGQFLKKVGGGDLGKPRVSGGKQVRVWAVRDFDDLKSVSNEVLSLAYGGMPWKKAALEIQKPRQDRDIPSHRLIEANARATAAE